MLLLVVPFILHYWPHYKDAKANNCYIVFITVVILWISRLIPAWTAGLLLPFGFIVLNVVTPNEHQSSTSIILSLMFQGPILQIIASFAVSIFVERITIALLHSEPSDCLSNQEAREPPSPATPKGLSQYPTATATTRATQKSVAPTTPTTKAQIDFESQQSIPFQDTPKINCVTFPIQIFFLMLLNIVLCSVMTNVCAGRMIRNILKAKTKITSNEDAFSIERSYNNGLDNNQNDNESVGAINTGSNVVVLSLCASSNIGAFLTPISSPLAIVANGIMPMNWSEWIQFSLPITGLSFFIFYLFVILPYCMPGYYKNKENPLVQGGQGILVKISSLGNDGYSAGGYNAGGDGAGDSNTCTNSENSHNNNARKYFNCFVGYTLLFGSMVMCYLVNSKQPVKGRELTNILGIYSIVPLVVVFMVGDLDLRMDIPWDLILLCMATLPLGGIAEQSGMIAGMKVMIKKRVSFLPLKLQFPCMLLAMMVGGTLKSHLATGLVILPPTMSYVADLGTSGYNLKWLFMCCLASISAGSYLRQSTLPNEDVCRGESHDGEDEEGDDLLMEMRMMRRSSLEPSHSVYPEAPPPYDPSKIESKHLIRIVIPQGIVMVSVAIGNSIYALSNKN